MGACHAPIGSLTGHDAWVIGDEPYVAIDFSGSEE
jgi:hypothetical protein